MAPANVDGQRGEGLPMSILRSHSLFLQVEMDEAERALIAEADAADAAAADGMPNQAPAGGEPEEAQPPPSTGDAVMDLEDEEEPEQMKIVRDYKRPEQRQAAAVLVVAAVV